VLKTPLIENPKAHLPDAELVELCKDGSLDAFRELVRRYETLVFGTCMKMLGSPEDAEEVCQDAFLQVFYKMKQFEGRAAFKTWLYRIVFNLCLNRRKSVATRRQRETQAGEMILRDTESHELFETPLDDRVQETLGRLREEEKEVIMRRFIFDQSLNEMADGLQLKLSATKMRLYRAMEEFKRVYTSLPIS